MLLFYRRSHLTSGAAAVVCRSLAAAPRRAHSGYRAWTAEAAHSSVGAADFPELQVVSLRTEGGKKSVLITSQCGLMTVFVAVR